MTRPPGSTMSIPSLMVCAIPFPWIFGFTSTAGNTSGLSAAASNGAAKIAVSAKRRTRDRCLAMGGSFPEQEGIRVSTVAIVPRREESNRNATTEARRIAHLALVIGPGDAGGENPPLVHEAA